MATNRGISRQVVVTEIPRDAATDSVSNDDAIVGEAEGAVDDVERRARPRGYPAARRGYACAEFFSAARECCGNKSEWPAPFLLALALEQQKGKILCHDIQDVRRYRGNGRYLRKLACARANGSGKNR